MKKLSELLGVKLNTIWRWEKERASPSVETAKNLAKILGITESELLNGPKDEKIRITLVYDWDRMKEVNIDMNGNEFELILGSNGQVGLKGSGMLTSHEAIDDFLARIREQLEVAFDAQVRRGVIQGN